MAFPLFCRNCIEETGGEQGQDGSSVELSEQRRQWPIVMGYKDIESGEHVFPVRFVDLIMFRTECIPATARRLIN